MTRPWAVVKNLAAAAAQIGFKPRRQRWDGPIVGNSRRDLLGGEMLSKNQRKKVIADVTRAMAYRQLRTGESISHGCLYWAHEFNRRMKQEGVRAIIQAGSSSWPRISAKNDDGMIDTHFSYVWEPDSSMTLARIASEEMPEMHVWSAIPAEGEIVDLTTGFLKLNCRELIGKDWPDCPPPTYLWCRHDELPDRVVYKADEKAIVLAMRMLQKSLTVRRFVPARFVD